MTVLVSSAGRRGALIGELRAAGVRLGLELRVVATDMNTLTAAGRLSDELHLVPAVSDPRYPEVITEICRNTGASLIVPTIDPELPVLAALRGALGEQGVAVLVSSPATILITADKENSARFLEGAGFPVPRRFALDDGADIAPGDWPLFYKPRQGSSSVGAGPVGSPAELEAAAARYPNGVLEELVEGPEYSIDTYVDLEGRCRGAVPRLRLVVRAGEVAKARTVDRADLVDLATRISESLPGAWGPLTVQIIDGPAGPRVIEVNARMGGGSPLTWHAGGRYLDAALAEARMLPVPPDWFEWRSGELMLRYDEAVFVEEPSEDA